jgi:hypothetical protein
MAGRHGNKGIVSQILPIQDMPYLPNGKTVDLILNPLGVPSRMNVGQLFEGLFGFAGHILDKRFKIIPFDEMFEMEASRILINNSLIKAKIKTKNNWIYNTISPGKILLKDGRTGEYFENSITVCNSYFLKLIHLVDDKIHARSTGPYSLITQQPLGGKSQQGGQRFGEMEVWALEAFGAAYTLQELLTLKSDDMNGRNETFISIINGEEIPDEFKTKYNVRYTTTVDFNRFQKNTSRILFATPPNISITEARTAYVSRSLGPLDTVTVSGSGIYRYQRSYPLLELFLVRTKIIGLPRAHASTSMVEHPLRTKTSALKTLLAISPSTNFTFLIFNDFMYALCNLP